MPKTARPARTMAKVTAAQRKLVRRLRTVREVNGVGITRAEAGFCLKVNLSVRPRAGLALPEEIDGIPVRVAVVGPIRARPRGMVGPIRARARGESETDRTTP